VRNYFPIQQRRKSARVNALSGASFVVARISTTLTRNEIPKGQLIKADADDRESFDKEGFHFVYSPQRRFTLALRGKNGVRAKEPSRGTFGYFPSRGDDRTASVIGEESLIIATGPSGDTRGNASVHCLVKYTLIIRRTGRTG